MDVSLVTQASAAFGAGMLSSLSPCVYPMIPISIGYLGTQTGAHQKISVSLFVLGQIFTFTALGLVAVKFGEVFGFSSELSWINAAMGLLMIAFGVSSLFNYVPSFIHNWNSLSRKVHAVEVHDYVMPVLIGIGSALLASPCTSPILGTVLLTLSQEATFERGLLMMVSYSIGTSLLFLAIGFGLVALDRFPRAGLWMTYVHKFSGVLIIGVGVFYLARGFF